MSTVVDDVVEVVEPQFGFISLSANSRAPVLLALDIGSSGVRAALFDEQGLEIDGASVRCGYGSASLDFATFDADTLLERVAQTIDELFATFTSSSVRIELIAVSCFWHSLVGVDAAGCAITPIFGWADSRAAGEILRLRSEFDEAKTHARTGCRFHQSYWPAKLRWLQADKPRVLEDTKCWLSFADYLTLQLFGETVTSVSMASGTGLLNQRTCAWDSELLQAAAVTADSLPAIAEPGQSFRNLTPAYGMRWPQLSDARLYPAIGDGAANSIGSGCNTVEKLALMIGTSGAMRVCFTGDVPTQLPPELWCYRVDRNRVVIGGALSDGGGLYHLLKESLLPGQDSQEIEEELSLLGAAAHGLTVLPFWAGERSTGWNPEAHGVVLGLSLQTRPIEILRAAMEAIAYRFALIARALEPFAPAATLVASGHALRSSPTWVQILADVLGRRVLLPEPSESSLRGAALLALEAAGKIQSIEDFILPVEFACEPNVASGLRYQQALDRQERIYRKLFS